MSADGSGSGRFVEDLGAAASAGLASVGGKALNLGRLIEAGFPVPPGFCLTTAAYRLAAPAPLDALASLLDRSGAGQGAVPADPAPGEVARQARELIITAPIPAAVDAAVRSAYAALGPAVRVAVRSSATAEDLPFTSFAGQQESYLDIVGADHVVQAVRRCWSSLWTERAVAYRSAHGIGHRSAGLAVVVQRMVEAVSAGVLFTANPVTGTRGETVINSSQGPGIAVVSGSVNPQHVVVDTATGRIVPGPPETPHPRTGPRRPGLAESQVRQLTGLAAEVQKLFGAPQDIEWVIDAGGKIWLTQSRPITALYPVPVAEDPGPGPGAGDSTRVYACVTLLQGLTRPITPMGAAVMQAIADRKGKWEYAYPGLRMYVDLTPVVRSKAGRRFLLRALPLADGRSAAVFPALLTDPRFEVRRRTPGRHRPTSTVPRKSRSTGGRVRPLFTARVIWAMIGALLQPEAELRRAQAYGERLEAEAALPEPATPARRLDHAQRILDPSIDGIFLATLPGPAAGYLALALARLLLRGIAEPRELEAVLRGLPHNVTTEMDLELWRLATSIGTDPPARETFLSAGPAELAAAYRAGALPAAVQTGLGAFLAGYGHRAVAEIDLGMPRWSEEPEHLLGMISNYLRIADPEQAPEMQFRRARDHAEARIHDLVERSRLRGPLRARLVQWSLLRARRLAGLRELPKFYAVVVLADIRRQLQAVGAALAAAGRIAAAEDVFFLDFDEARVGLRGADLKALVAGRRRLYEAELLRRRIPRFLLSDGTDVEAAIVAASRTADGSLAGTPASAGTATGTVRVIMDPLGAHLEPGEILVAPSTDPGWTPLFLTAGALVMEMGGVISHGAVVAREYGIPAVVGVPEATALLHTGQRVTVDGAAGTVTPDNGSPPVGPRREAAAADPGVG